ncbi:MAG: HAD family phosphatase [Pseudomonadota bacterium]
MAFKALVFDFDGIITDTEPVHMEAWQGVLEPLGVFIEEDEFKSEYVGLNDRDFLDAVSRNHKHHFADTEKSKLIEQKCVATISLLENEIPVLPGVETFINSSKDRYLLAICSGANRAEIEFILRRLRWNGLFNPVVASDSVSKGKPDPEGYIRALEGLDDRASDVVLAENVVAIEDSPKGIAAAKAAGLRCLAVSNSFNAESLSQADWVVESLMDVDMNELSLRA